MVLEKWGKWPYSCCFVGCCFQDLFNIACSILCSSHQAFSQCVLSGSMLILHDGFTTLTPIYRYIYIYIYIYIYVVQFDGDSNSVFALYFNSLLFTLSSLLNLGGGPCGVMVKAMDCGIVVREFVLQSRYYVHFRANTLGKGMTPLILLAIG